MKPRNMRLIPSALRNNDSQHMRKLESSSLDRCIDQSLLRLSPVRQMRKCAQKFQQQGSAPPFVRSFPASTATAKTSYSPADIEGAHAKIARKILHTPIMTSDYINLLVPQAEVFFKAELLQKTGSFKFRGALHALSCLPPADLARGVVAHSSGNHGLALAYAAQILGIKCSIVMVFPV